LGDRTVVGGVRAARKDTSDRVAVCEASGVACVDAVGGANGGRVGREWGC